MRVVVVIIVVIGLALSGCRTPRTAISSSSSDTIRIIERVLARDTTIVVPADNSSIEASLDLLLQSQQELVSQSGRSRVTLAYNPETKTITADCECDSNALKVRLYEKFLSEMRSKTSEHKEVKTKSAIPAWIWIVGACVMIFMFLLGRAKITF